MVRFLASRIVPRTTINLDGPVLPDRKLATAPALDLQWISRPMGALVDLDDKEELFAALDQSIQLL
jgi:hypothetical protein